MLLASVFKLTHEGLAEARMWWEVTEEEKDGLAPIRGVLPQGLPSTRHGAVSVREVDGWLHPHSAWQMVTVFLSLLACMLGFLPPHFKMSPSPLAFPATCFYLYNSLNVLQTPLSWFKLDKWQCIFSRFQEVPGIYLSLFNRALSNAIFVIIIIIFSSWVRSMGHILNSIFLFHLTDLAPVVDHILLLCTFYACKINKYVVLVLATPFLSNCVTFFSCTREELCLLSPAHRHQETRRKCLGVRPSFSPARMVFCYSSSLGTRWKKSGKLGSD